MSQKKKVTFLTVGAIWTVFVGILSLVFGSITSAPAAAPPPTATPVPGPVVASIFFEDVDDLNKLAGELDIWEVDHKQRILLAQLLPEQVAALRQAGYRLDIDLAKTARLHQPLRANVGQTRGIPGYACYRTVEETYTDLADLAANNPNLAAWLDIGDSWQKANSEAGYDIYALVLTNHKLTGPKPKLFMMSAVHARELATAELTTRFAEYLIANYDIDPDITFLLDHFELHMVPQANPDGRKQAETGLSWRKNVDNDDGCLSPSSWGVDLNRNSSFKWNHCAGAGCSSGNPCVITYRGPEAASEPEVQAIEAYVASIFPDQRGPNDDDPAPADAMGIFITVHSYGQWILFPWGWDTAPPPNRTELETLGRKFGYYTDYKVCQAGDTSGPTACLYLADGLNDDWAYGALGLAAYTFEVGVTFFESCSYFEKVIIPENFPALLYAFKAARRPYQVPAGPETLQVTTTPTTVVAGYPITLTAVANDTLYDSNGWGSEPWQNIAAMRYTVNAPSWGSGVISYPLTAVDGIFDAPIEAAQTVINTAGWMPGRYHLIVESQDSAGNWGVPTTTFLQITGGVTVTPTTSLQLAAPGQVVSYTLSVASTGFFSDTFDLHITGNLWPTTTPSNSVSLIVEGSTLLPIIPIIVTVQVPANTATGDFDTAAITFKARTTGLELPPILLLTKVKGDLYLPLLQKD